MDSDGWVPIRLGSVCMKIGSGATPRGGSEVYLDSGPYALIRSQNVYNEGFHHDGLAFIGEKHSEELINVEVKKDDVLLNITGDSVARCCQVDPAVLPARVNQHVAIVRPNPEKLNPCFLRYLLVSHEMQTRLLSWAGSGGTRNALTKGMIESLEMVVPEDIDEQRAIAHILGTLDNKIELNRKMNETLEAMAQAIFKSWFVDFDPVRAKANGRQPDGLAPEIAKLFPDSFQPSELGEIPKGWKICKLREFASLDKGLSYKGQYLTGGGVPMVNLGCFVGAGRFNESAVKPYAGEYKSRHTIAPGDLVMANTDITQKRKVLGSPAILPPISDFDKLIFTHHVYAFRFHTNHEIWKLFIYYSLLQDEFRERAAGFATGTTVLALPRDAVLELQFATPSTELALAYDLQITPFLERQWKNNDESRTLVTIRDALLPKLLSGEIRVKDAEKFVEGKI